MSAILTTRTKSWVAYEAKCLSELKGLAFRNGHILKLKLENGKFKTFQDRPCDRYDSGTCSTYAVAGYRPAQNLFIVEQSYFEDSTFWIVGGRTGDMTGLGGTMPEFSPTGRWLVSVDADDMNGVEYDVEIWSVGLGKLERKLAYSSKGKSYESWEFAGWDGDGRIKLKVASGEHDGVVETDAVLTEQGWKLNFPEIKQKIP